METQNLNAPATVEQNGITHINGLLPQETKPAQEPEKKQISIIKPAPKPASRKPSPNKSSQAVVKKAEVKTEIKRFKPAIGETIEIIKDLHLKTIQRGRLEMYADHLNSFEIVQQDDDLNGKGNFQNCLITIMDDKRNTFELKNATLIKEVVKFLSGRFQDKIAEIEAHLVFP